MSAPNVEKRFCSRTRQSVPAWVFPAGVLALALGAILLDRPWLWSAFWGSLPGLLVLFHPQSGSGSLIVDAQGLCIEPLLGARRFAKRVAWSEIRDIGLEEQNGRTMLRIVRRDYVTMQWAIGVYGPVDEIVAAIRAHVELDPEPLRSNAALGADIGERPLHVLGVAMAALVLTMVVHGWAPKAWHTSAETLLAPALVTVPLAILGAGLWIRRDRKAYPWPAAILSGLVLGLVLNFTVLTGNRLLTEAGWRTEERAEFRLDEIKTESGRLRQRWRPLDPHAWRFDKGRFHVRQSWPGYDATLQAGATYRVTVWRGALNDIAFPPDAFHAAQRVD